MATSESNRVDTIAAQATPAGRGGVAIIRVSGPQVKMIAQHMTQLSLTPRYATLALFYDDKNTVIDQGIAIYFPQPHSFTGEDVLELHCHGGPVVVDLLLQQVLRLGARLAKPGEFSERAFLNDKLDLAQAEAIADLINATSEQAARSAMRSLQGEFSREVNAINERIIYIRMYIEAAIDFVDEEIDFLQAGKILTELKNIQHALSAILHKAQQGCFLREGIHIAIIGEPNVGKSSLLNALSGKEVAIVTDIPGTTRDVLRDVILLDGMPIHLVDTAGIRDSLDQVEQEGIRRAYQEMEHADVVLYVFDATSYPKDLVMIAEKLMVLPVIEKLHQRQVIFVRNKIDQLSLAASMEEINLNGHGQLFISLSAKTTAGMELLKTAIKKQMGFHSGEEGTYLARRRHLDALLQALTHVEGSIERLQSNGASELAAEDLRLAQRALNELTGEFTADDLLGKIFSSFCIGK